MCILVSDSSSLGLHNTTRVNRLFGPALALPDRLRGSIVIARLDGDDGLEGVHDVVVEALVLVALLRLGLVAAAAAAKGGGAPGLGEAAVDGVGGAGVGGAEEAGDEVVEEGLDGGEGAADDGEVGFSETGKGGLIRGGG